MDAPTRHREAEARSARLGRPLRRLGRVEAVDEELMDRIGRGFLERDEVGARLADAIRTRAVSMAQFRDALEHGVTDGAPEALRQFFTEVETVPGWVDWRLLEEGGGVYRRFGQNAADALLQLSLVGGYRFGGPTDLLVATGGLTGDQTLRRLAETQKWATSLSEPGAMRPRGEGWRLTVHVRLMHAMVNSSFEERWDVHRWGLPINQTDQGSTLGLFDGVPLIACRALGVPISNAESRAVMHLWKYVGHLMGVDPDFLVDRERDRHRLNYHVLLAQADLSEAGPQLAQAIVAAQRQRRFGRWQRTRGRFEQERLLSMLTVFLGPTSMRELGLPVRPPWAFAYVVPLNVLRYRVLGRTPWGRRRLDAWGRRVSARILDSYFVGDEHAVGEVPA